MPASPPQAPTADVSVPRRNAPLRWRILAAVGCTAVSAVMHLLTMQGPSRIMSDTNTYIEVAALLHGRPTLDAATPFRVGHGPLYGLATYVSTLLVEDWQRAAQLAALLSSILVAPVVCLIAWQLDRRLLSGLLAGMAAALSAALTSMGSVPMSESLFVLLTALYVAASITFLRRPGVATGAATGLFAGLAWATRGPGIAYPLITLVALVAAGPVSIPGYREARFVVTAFMRSLAGFRRKAPMNRGTTNGSNRFLHVPAALALVLAFVVAGKTPTLLLCPYVGDRPPSNIGSYAKLQLVWQGSRYTDVPYEFADLQYRLNDDCTNHLLAEVINRPWSVLLSEFGRGQLLAYLANLRRNVTVVMPELLYPLAVTFLPLAIGMVLLWRRSQTGVLVLLLLFGLLHLVAIPLAGPDSRYVLPLLTVAMPAIGIGMGELAGYGGHSDRGRTLLARAAAAVLMVLLVALNVYGVCQETSEEDTQETYRRACTWLSGRGTGPEDVFLVFHRNAYTFLGCRRTVPLPRDSLDRVARYCRHVGADYVITSTSRGVPHNRHLAEAVDTGGESLIREGVEFRPIARFGDPAEEEIRVFELHIGPKGSAQH